MVMATGIVAVGAGQRGWETVSVILIVLTAIEYGILVLLTLWRLIAFRAEVVADLHDSRTAFLFFTFVAGTNVLAVALAGRHLLVASVALLCVGAAVWIVLGYTVPWVAVLSRDERPVVAEAMFKSGERCMKTVPPLKALHDDILKLSFTRPTSCVITVSTPDTHLPSPSCMLHPVSHSLESAMCDAKRSPDSARILFSSSLFQQPR